MRFRSLLMGGPLAASALFFSPDSRACGGCFPPQGEQNSVVTDHRMVFAISETQSTLYDQIQYSGAPSEFAWILPISGTVDVGISAQSLFSGLDTLTSVVVQTPPTNCPGPPAGCEYPESDSAKSAGSSGGASSSGGPLALDAGVSVLKTEVVGPYETVQLHPNSPTDVAALEDWLTQHNYVVPADIEPVIADYVQHSFNFLALRLKPGAGVNSMRPVRVTTKGANVALPLKMVAAGTGATVGITLWVVSSGRYEPQNFSSFTIKNEDLTWDWTTSSSNYAAVRTTKQGPNGNLWEVESATTLFQGQIQSAATFAGYASGGYGDGGDYLATDTKTAAEVQQEDFTTLLGGTQDDSASLHVTRMRADIAHAALNNDLILAASADQSDLPRTRVPTAESGQPLCPVYDQCSVTGQLPRDQAIAKNAANTLPMGGGCTSVPRRENAGVTAAFALVAVAVGRSIRKRRRSR